MRRSQGTVSSKKLPVLVVLLVVACTVLGLGYKLIAHAAAGGVACGSDYANPSGLTWTGDGPSSDEWNQTGYVYEVYSFGINTANPDGFGTGGNGQSGDFINTNNAIGCSGINPSQGINTSTSDISNSNVVTINPANMPGQPLPAVDVRMGYPANNVLPASASPNQPDDADRLYPIDGAYIGDPFNGVNGSGPVFGFSDTGRAAAYVNDAGRAEINNVTVMCAGYNVSDGSPLPYSTCWPNDLGQQTHTAPNGTQEPFSGTGYLFAPDNCAPAVEANSQPGGDTGVWPESLTCNPAYSDFDWYNNLPGSPSPLSYNDIIGTNPDGSLKPFRLDMQSENTFAGGGSTVLWMTFKFPANWLLSSTITHCSNPGLSCIIQTSTPKDVSVSVTNSGGTSPAANLDVAEICPPTGLTTTSTPCTPNQPIPLESDITLSNLSGATEPGVPPHTSGSDCGPNVPDNTNSPPCTVNNHMEWNYTSIPAGTTNNGGFTFSVTTAAADDSQVCFEAWAAPPTPTSYYPSYNSPNGPDGSSGISCWYILNAQDPYFTTTQSDVHVGGSVGQGSCPTADYPSNPSLDGLLKGSDAAYQAATTAIPGSQFGSSLAQYIASATGAISSVSSGNDSGSTSLNLGVSGSYANGICRPNLAEAAIKYANQKYGSLASAPDPGPSGTFTTSALNGGDGTLYYHNGNVTINAGNTIPSRVTLFVNGNVTIDGNINVSSSCQNVASKHICPSFGLIATGNINIGNTVTSLTGYYSAGNPLSPLALPGSVNTCSSVAPVTCENQLTVTGFLEGYQINLGRFCPVAQSGPCLAEIANMSGTLYLSTPPAFDTISTDEDLPQYGGELPPLY